MELSCGNSASISRAGYKYGWYLQNSGDRTWLVGSKKPNDLGLFDLHGNVYSWCQERYQSYPKVEEGKTIEDIEDILSINSQDSRVLRGGSFGSQASIVRSGRRNYSVPTNRNTRYGFRLARTFR